MRLGLLKIFFLIFRQDGISVPHTFSLSICFIFVFSARPTASVSASGARRELIRWDAGSSWGGELTSLSNLERHSPHRTSRFRNRGMSILAAPDLQRLLRLALRSFCLSQLHDMVRSARQHSERRVSRRCGRIRYRVSVPPGCFQ